MHCLPRAHRDRMVLVAPDVTQPCHTQGKPPGSLWISNSLSLSPLQAAGLLPALMERTHMGMELHPVCFPTSLPRLK